MRCCPRCGGTNIIEWSPGFFECSSMRSVPDGLGLAPELGHLPWLGPMVPVQAPVICVWLALVASHQPRRRTAPLRLQLGRGGTVRRLFQTRMPSPRQLQPGRCALRRVHEELRRSFG